MSSPVKFSFNWLMLQETADPLIKELENMPKIVPTIGVVTKIVIDETDKIVDAEHVCDLPAIPDEKTLQSATYAINVEGEGETYFFMSSGIGICNSAAVRMMAEIRKTVEFTVGLSNAVQWLDGTVKHSNSGFCEWLLNKLNEPTPYLLQLTRKKRYNPVACHFFSPNFYFDDNNPPVMDDFFSMCLEDRLSVRSLEVIMAFFRYCYSRDGRNLFLQVDASKDIGPSGNQSPEMVYAFVERSGVVCLDLLQYKISFGDSCGRIAPVDEVRTLIQRLMPSKEDESRWDKAMKSIGQFKFPETANGSCSILAAMAIEQAVNPFFDRKDASAELQRIRYLRLFTRHIKAEEDEVAMSYWEHHPDERPDGEKEFEHFSEMLVPSRNLPKKVTFDMSAFPDDDLDTLDEDLGSEEKRGNEGPKRKRGESDEGRVTRARKGSGKVRMKEQRKE